MKIESLSSRESSTFIQDFAAFPGEVRQEPYRIGLAPEIVAKNFMSAPFPSAHDFFLLRDGNKILGRLSANISSLDPKTGMLGFFETDLRDENSEAAASKLLEHGANWLKQKGASKIYGPLNFSTWFSYRFRVSEEDTIRFAWEPTQPPEFPEFFRKAGFKEDMYYASRGYEKKEDMETFLAGTLPGYETALKAGFTYEQMSPARLLKEDLPDLYSISMESFTENHLFEPISFEAFSQLYIPLVNLIDITPSFFVKNSQGKRVGFFFCFVDRDYLVMKTIAMLPEARGHGLSNGLYYLSTKCAQERGIYKLIHALIQSGNQSESYGKKTTYQWRHDYALFSKMI